MKINLKEAEDGPFLKNCERIYCRILTGTLLMICLDYLDYIFSEAKPYIRKFKASYLFTIPIPLL